ncbi:MAG: succinate dehydrogenase iron-sulfur subunit [Anaerolineaceae bacterium]|nr:succinate dehydrogenase iron-sulfur subunit [Anaerolineaceae bacterium]
MQITVKLYRFNPVIEQKPHYDSHTLVVDPDDRVLDVLERIKGFTDGTLSFRRSCGHGVCGSDAMRINGRNRLACKVLIQDLDSDVITIEPLLGLKVMRDLIVDMGPFFNHYKAVVPYFISDLPIPADGKERLQSPADRAKIDDTTKCILCAACTTACPSFWSNGKYVGPAAIVNAHRFIFDSRDTAAAERLKVLAQPDGVWRCRTIFNCTEACPRDIKVTKAISEVKQAITTGDLDVVEVIDEEKASSS